MGFNQLENDNHVNDKRFEIMEFLIKKNDFGLGYRNDPWTFVIVFNLSSDIFWNIPKWQNEQVLRFKQPPNSWGVLRHLNPDHLAENAYN